MEMTILWVIKLIKTKFKEEEGEGGEILAIEFRMCLSNFGLV